MVFSFVVALFFLACLLQCFLSMVQYHLERRAIYTHGDGSRACHDLDLASIMEASLVVRWNPENTSCVEKLLSTQVLVEDEVSRRFGIRRRLSLPYGEIMKSCVINTWGCRSVNYPPKLRPDKPIIRETEIVNPTRRPRRQQLDTLHKFSQTYCGHLGVP